MIMMRMGVLSSSGMAFSCKDPSQVEAIYHLWDKDAKCYPHCGYCCLCIKSSSGKRGSMAWINCIESTILVGWFTLGYGGDFNQIIHLDEHSSPAENHLTSHMIGLRDCLLQLGVFYLRFIGPYHTWTNNRPEDPITEKLVRLLVNHSWISAFPNSLATFSAPLISDHSPCSLDISCNLPSAGTKPFRFFNFLTKHAFFGQSVETVWLDCGFCETYLASFCRKLKALKRCLKILNKDNFSNI